MRAVFRADASGAIGSGHVMRCLTLATALRDRGTAASFFCRDDDGDLCELIERQGFTLGRLSASGSAGSWEEDARQTREFAESFCAKPDWLIVDHYRLDRRWDRVLRPAVGRIMVIDDLADRVHDCDLLLDQNLVADMYTRHLDKVPESCGTLLGPNYALLQPRYTDLHERTPPREGHVQRILIFFGGGDSDNVTGRALSAVLNAHRSDINVDVVIAPFSPHADSIRRQASGHDNVRLHSGLTTLAPLMAIADLAIGACGAASWERLCMGLPTIVVTVADNQRAIAEELSRRDLIYWLGPQEKVDETVLSQALERMLQRELDETWSLRCFSAVDGKGVERVCAALNVTAVASWPVRHVKWADEAMLLDWANNSVTRRNSFSPAPITPSAHRSWFRGRLRDVDGCRFYIVETVEGVAIGQVRFEKNVDTWEVHYSLAPMFRGRGFGRSFLESALRKLLTEVPGATVFGHVKFDNVSSRKIFESLGFEARPAADGVVEYHRPPHVPQPASSSPHTLPITNSRTTASSL